MSAPNHEERQKCWAARDGYWACLDKSKEDKTKCEKDRELFEGNCSRTWVKYFDRRRDYLKYKEKMEKDGFEPTDDKKGKKAL